MCFLSLQAERAEHLLRHLCHDDYGNIKLTPHMVNLVIDAWVRQYLTLESENIFKSTQHHDRIQ